MELSKSARCLLSNIAEIEADIENLKKTNAHKDLTIANLEQTIMFTLSRLNYEKVNVRVAHDADKNQNAINVWANATLDEKVELSKRKTIKPGSPEDLQPTEIYMVLQPDVDYAVIKNLFAPIAKVQNVRIRQTPRRDGGLFKFAFVLFATKTDAQKVLNWPFAWADGTPVYKQAMREPSNDPWRT